MQKKTLEEFCLKQELYDMKAKFEKDYARIAYVDKVRRELYDQIKQCALRSDHIGLKSIVDMHHKSLTEKQSHITEMRMLRETDRRENTSRFDIFKEQNEELEKSVARLSLETKNLQEQMPSKADVLEMQKMQKKFEGYASYQDYKELYLKVVPPIQ